MFDHPYAQEYAAFWLRIFALNEQKRADLKALLDTKNQEMREAVEANTQHGTPLPSMEDYDRKVSLIEEKYDTLLMGICQQHGLQECNQALKETGGAAYYDISPIPGRSLWATLSQEEQITLEVHITHTFPNEECATLRHGIRAYFPLGLTQPFWKATNTEDVQGDDKNDKLGKMLIRDVLLAHLAQAKENIPASNMLLHFLAIDAELGEGNDGLLYAYRKEAKAELDALLQEIEQGEKTE